MRKRRETPTQNETAQVPQLKALTQRIEGKPRREKRDSGLMA